MCNLGRLVARRGRECSSRCLSRPTVPAPVRCTHPDVFDHLPCAGTVRTIEWNETGAMLPGLCLHRDRSHTHTSWRYKENSWQRLRAAHRKVGVLCTCKSFTGDTHTFAHLCSRVNAWSCREFAFLDSYSWQAAAALSSLIADASTQLCDL